MKCHYAHSEIALISVQNAHPSDQLQHHMKTCEECRKHYQQQALDQWATEILDLNVEAIPAQAHVAPLAWIRC